MAYQRLIGDVPQGATLFYPKCFIYKMFARSFRAQSTLETAFVFVVLILLFGGIFNIWVWGNKQIVQRQKLFNQSRVPAGTSTRDYQLVWPVKRAESLKEEKVLLTPR